MRRKITATLLTLVVLLTAICLVGCAVRQTHAPQLTPAVVWELNTADQLKQLENNYKTFFRDVGDAQRQGILTKQQVAVLNEIGHRAKPAIEKANLSFKTWQRLGRDDNGKKAVVIALTAAQQILAELAAQRAVFGGGQ